MTDTISDLIPVRESSPTKRVRVDEPVVEVQDLWAAIDIEKTGPKMRFDVENKDLNNTNYHPILAVAIVVGRSDGTILEKRSFCASVPPEKLFDAKCWDQFWVNHPKSLAEIAAQSTPFHLQQFYAFIVLIHKTFGPFGRGVAGVRNKFRWLSDNPAYDIGLMNLALGDLGVNLPLAEMFESYVPTDDPTERQEGLSPLQSAFVDTLVTASHDHNPVRDAENIFQRACAFKAVKECSTYSVNEDGDEVIKIDTERLEKRREKFEWTQSSMKL